MAKSKTSKVVLPDDNFYIRNFRIEVYEDWENFNQVQEFINKNYLQFIGIRHDKDVWTLQQYSEKKEYCDERGIVAGQLKKPHWHYVIKFNNPRYRFTIAKELGINERFVLPCNNYRKAVEYLIHLNEDDKIEYSVDNCIGSLVLDLKKFIQGRIYEEDKSNEIIDLIIDHKSWLLPDLMKEINKRGLYSTFRQGWSIYKVILEEHNTGIY